MKVGDEIKCKFCGANSFLVKKTIMEGWTKTGEVLICSSCSKVIHKILIDEKQSESITKENINKTSLDKFSNFLGGEKIKRPVIKEEEKHFCRDCKHYISHPFLDRCSLRQVEVNPMDDCELFER